MRRSLPILLVVAALGALGLLVAWMIERPEESAISSSASVPSGDSSFAARRPPRPETILSDEDPRPPSPAPGAIASDAETSPAPASRELVLRVVTESGAPASGAEVAFWEASHRSGGLSALESWRRERAEAAAPLLETRCDAEGVCRLSGSFASLLLVRARHRISELGQAILASPFDEEFVLRLGTGRRLLGRVVADEGRPVASAEVLVIPDLDPVAGRRRILSGADGRFEALVPEGALRLQAVHPDFAPSEEFLVEASNRDEAVLRLDGGRLLRIGFRGFAAVDRDRPVSVIAVGRGRGVGAAADPMVVEGRLGEELVLRISRSHRALGLDIEAPPYRPRREALPRGIRFAAYPGVLDLETSAIGEGPLVFELSRGASVRGRVLGPEGAGLEGLALVAIPDTARHGHFVPARAPRLRSGPGGRFAFEGLDAEPTTFFIDDAAWTGCFAGGEAGLLRIDLGRTPEVEDAEILAARRPTLAGRVVTAAGRPQAGALVWISGLESPLRAGVRRHLRSLRDAWKFDPATEHGVCPLSRADAEGRFEVRGLAPGEDLRLEALGDGARGRLEVAPLGAGERREVEVRLDDADFGGLLLEIRDEDGAPVVDAIARLRSLEADRRIRSARTASSGEARFGGLPRGRHLLEVVFPDHPDWTLLTGERLEIEILPRVEAQRRLVAVPGTLYEFEVAGVPAPIGEALADLGCSHPRWTGGRELLHVIRSRRGPAGTFAFRTTLARGGVIRLLRLRAFPAGALEELELPLADGPAILGGRDTLRVR